MKNKSLPTVVVVGRTNVGKSTLFNRLSTSVRSLTLDYEGVTRDFISDTVCWQDTCFQLIDTGGISFKRTEDPVEQKSRQIALKMLDDADVVLFVCDGAAGVVLEDREISNLLHKHRKKTILAVNKIDTNLAQEQQYEFNQLGYDTIIPVSAQHGVGISELLESIIHLLPTHVRGYQEEEAACKVVILGRPNVGKSSLMNLLVGQERSIVTDRPGTTREAIAENIRFYKEIIQVVDTPGVRRKRGVTEPLEKLMVKSALHTVDESDVVLLVVDASQGSIVDQELKLAFYVFQEKYKGLVILYNKQDLMTEQLKKDLEFSLEPYEYFFKKIVQMNTSCVTEKNVGKIATIVSQVCERYRQQFSDVELTILFKEALQKKPIYRAEQVMHVYRAQQVRTGPITIALTVAEPRWWGPSQLGYLEQVLRSKYDLQGVPVRFVMRQRS